MSRPKENKPAARPYQIAAVYPADLERCHAMAAMEIATLLGSEAFLESNADDITKTTGIEPTRYADQLVDYLVWDIRPEAAMHPRWGEERDNAVYIALDRQMDRGPQIHVGRYASGAYVLYALRTVIGAMCPAIAPR